MAFEIPQTTMTQFPAVALEGMVADMRSAVIVSKLATVAIPVGRGVVKATAWDLCKLPALGTDITNLFQGVAILNSMREPGVPHYAINSAVSVLRRGAIWLLAEGDVTDEGPVFIVNGSGAGTPGKLRGDANTAAATQVTAAKVLKGATAGSLALVEFNLP